MNSCPFTHLICPIDGFALSHSQSAWCCPNGHNFDIAKQGYSNLLLVQNKRSLNPGDSKSMVAARRRFLQYGFYEPIAQAISDNIKFQPHSTPGLSCLDSGCGEGYYLNQIQILQRHSGLLSLIGLDISKWAVKSAASVYKNITWVVASNANIPVQENSLDYIFCIFGFPVYQEYSRILRTGGKLIMLDTGKKHLIELRKIIYPELHNKPNKTKIMPDEFTLLKTDNVTYSIQLPTQQQISDLLEMTPHLYKASNEGREKATILESLNLTIDAQLNIYTKT